MKERPILMDSESVRAILNGSKSQTRRPVAPANSLVNGYPSRKDFWERLDFSDAWVDPGPSPAGNAGPYLHVHLPEDDTWHRVYPRVGVGDTLWVREAWYQTPKTAYWHDPSIAHRVSSDGEWWAIYREDWERSAPWCWRPSVHMPRWASRITLEVVSVRAERVGEITLHDCCAEGPPWQVRVSSNANDYLDWFRKRWDALYSKRGFGWDVNPLVWAVEFRRVDGNGS